MQSTPEAPIDKLVDTRLAERHRQVIAQVICLLLFIATGDIKFSDPDGQRELSVISLKQLP